MCVVILERHGRIAVIRLNRPEAMNSLNRDMLLGIEKAVDEVADDPSIEIVVFTGEGRAFAAGADIAEMSELNEEQAMEYGLLGQRVFLKVEKLEKPTIAAINGFALGGGCELAMACDIRVASERAKFGQPELSLGITPGYSGTQRLPRIVGKAKAIEMILTGEMITAKEALSIGLVNKVVEPDDLREAVLAMATEIIKKAPTAVRHALRAIKEGSCMDLEEGNCLEVQLFSKCFRTADQKEGMNAFLEKRPAKFKGR